MSSGGEPEAGRVHVRYRRDDGQFADTTLDRLAVDDVVADRSGNSVRYKGRQYYWAGTAPRRSTPLVTYENRLELARIILADLDPSVTGIAAQPFLLTGPEPTSCS